MYCENTLDYSVQQIPILLQIKAVPLNFSVEYCSRNKRKSIAKRDHIQEKLEQKNSSACPSFIVLTAHGFLKHPWPPLFGMPPFLVAPTFGVATPPFICTTFTVTNPICSPATPSPSLCNQNVLYPLLYVLLTANDKICFFLSSNSRLHSISTSAFNSAGPAFSPRAYFPPLLRIIWLAPLLLLPCEICDFFGKSILNQVLI